MADVDLGARQQVEQVVAVRRAGGVDQDHPAAVRQRRPDVQQAQVEVERGVVEHRPARADVEGVGRPRDEPVHTGLAERDDLGQTGGPGRGQHEQDVGLVDRPRRAPLGGRYGQRVAVRHQRVAAVRVREQGGERLFGERGRGKQEPPAGQHTRQDQRDRGRRLLRQHADRFVRTEIEPDQLGAGLGRHLVELAVGDLLVVPDQRGGVWPGFDLGEERVL
jgi:hypothetical protein